MSSGPAGSQSNVKSRGDSNPRASVTSKEPAKKTTQALASIVVQAPTGPSPDEVAKLAQEQAELEQLRRDIEAQQAELKAQRETFEREREDLLNEKKTLALDKEQIELSVSEVEIQRLELEKEKEEMEAQKAKLTEQESVLSDKELALQKERDDNAARLAATEEEIKTRESALHEQENEVLHLKEEEEESMKKLQEQMKELQEQKKKLDVDGRELERQRTKMTIQQEQLETQSAEIKSASMETQEETEKLRRQREIVERMQQEVTEKKKDFEKRFADVEKKYAEVEKHQLGFEAKQKDWQIRQQELLAREEQADQREQKLHKEERKIEQLRTDLEEQKAQLKNKQQNLDRESEVLREKYEARAKAVEEQLEKELENIKKREAHIAAEIKKRPAGAVTPEGERGMKQLLGSVVLDKNHDDKAVQKGDKLSSAQRRSMQPVNKSVKLLPELDVKRFSELRLKIELKGMNRTYFVIDEPSFEVDQDTHLLGVYAEPEPRFVTVKVFDDATLFLNEVEVMKKLHSKADASDLVLGMLDYFQDYDGAGKHYIIFERGSACERLEQHLRKASDNDRSITEYYAIGVVKALAFVHTCSEFVIPNFDASKIVLVVEQVGGTRYARPKLCDLEHAAPVGSVANQRLPFSPLYNSPAKAKWLVQPAGTGAEEGYKLTKEDDVFSLGLLLYDLLGGGFPLAGREKGEEKFAKDYQRAMASSRWFEKVEWQRIKTKHWARFLDVVKDHLFNPSVAPERRFTAPSLFDYILRVEFKEPQLSPESIQTVVQAYVTQQGEPFPSTFVVLPAGAASGPLPLSAPMGRMCSSFPLSQDANAGARYCLHSLCGAHVFEQGADLARVLWHRHADAAGSPIKASRDSLSRLVGSLEWVIAGLRSVKRLEKIANNTDLTWVMDLEDDTGITLMGEEMKAQAWEQRELSGSALISMLKATRMRVNEGRTEAPEVLCKSVVKTGGPFGHAGTCLWLCAEHRALLDNWEEHCVKEKLSGSDLLKAGDKAGERVESKWKEVVKRAVEIAEVADAAVPPVVRVSAASAGAGACALM